MTFNRRSLNISFFFSSIKITDKQQEVDVQVDNQQPMSSVSQKARSPRTMSQISGFKRPLMHTNSFTSDRLPLYGVETPHEATLGAMLSEVSTWGIDIFKIGTLSCNRPLTCVAYQIFQVKSFFCDKFFEDSRNVFLFALTLLQGWETFLEKI